MKDVYSFVANNGNTIVGCDSHLLESKDAAYEMATNLLGIFIDANNIEIFKYNNNKFVFFGSVQGKKDMKKEYGLIEDYLYGRILGKGENMILDTTKDELRIYWCLDKVEVFINNRFVPFSDIKIETLVGSYARVHKDSFPFLNY